MKAVGQGTQPKIAQPEDIQDKADRHEREIEDIRDNLSHLLRELDRRRHRLAPRALIDEHPLTAAAIGLAIVTAIGGGLVMHSRRKQQGSLQTRSLRARKRRLAVHAPIAKSSPGSGERILMAVTTAMASTVARQLIKGYFARTSAPPSGSRRA